MATAKRGNCLTKRTITETFDEMNGWITTQEEETETRYRLELSADEAYELVKTIGAYDLHLKEIEFKGTADVKHIKEALEAVIAGEETVTRH